MLNEQIDKFRQEIADIRVQNAKLASQVILLMFLFESMSY